jgi:hypothetical protein
MNTLCVKFEPDVAPIPDFFGLLLFPLILSYSGIKPQKWTD